MRFLQNVRIVLTIFFVGFFWLLPSKSSIGAIDDVSIGSLPSRSSISVIDNGCVYFFDYPFLKPDTYMTTSIDLKEKVDYLLTKLPYNITSCQRIRFELSDEKSKKLFIDNQKKIEESVIDYLVKGSNYFDNVVGISKFRMLFDVAVIIVLRDFKLMKKEVAIDTLISTLILKKTANNDSNDYSAGEESNYLRYMLQYDYHKNLLIDLVKKYENGQKK